MSSVVANISRELLPTEFCEFELNTACDVECVLGQMKKGSFVFHYKRVVGEFVSITTTGFTQPLPGSSLTPTPPLECMITRTLAPVLL